eukprot:9367498-Pyramimonas_sp.AAC.1
MEAMKEHLEKIAGDGKQIAKVIPTRTRRPRSRRGSGSTPTRRTAVRRVGDHEGLRAAGARAREFRGHDPFTSAPEGDAGQRGVARSRGGVWRLQWSCLPGAAHRGPHLPGAATRSKSIWRTCSGCAARISRTQRSTEGLGGSQREHHGGAGHGQGPLRR